jgi:hypothetical protein
LDRDGKVLTHVETVLQGPDVEAGGKGTWSLPLTIETEPGMAGKIHAFSRSPLDGSIVAEDSVEVILGQSAPKPTFLEIDEPSEGAVLDVSQPIQVNGTGGGLPEGNVVVRALDASDRVLAEQATILQGQDVGSGGAGTWSVQLLVGAPLGTTGQIVAFSPSPADDESYVASAVVNVVYGGGGGLEGTTWTLGNTLPNTEITAVFDNGQVSGSAGCNNYQGGYTTAGQDTIQIGPLASTMMMCSENIMTQEQEYLAAFQSATSYRIEENILTLNHPDGALLFEDQTIP